MRCQRCGGYLDPMPYYLENGTKIDQTRCVNCARIRFNKTPDKDRVKPRTTGRGKDRHHRQGYGASGRIKELVQKEPELGNKEIADRFGRTESWVAQCRTAVERAKEYNGRPRIKKVRRYGLG